ncbi:MAG: hypothetical protein AAB367_00455 [Patescibacteria group bacterium]
MSGRPAMAGRPDSRSGYELFQIDVLASDQWRAQFRSINDYGRERRLMLAVLEDAIDCFQKYAHTNDRGGRQIFCEAYDWIMSPDKRWLFSFENICQIVEMDPDYIREGLMRWRASGNRVEETDLVKEPE